MADPDLIVAYEAISVKTVLLITGQMPDDEVLRWTDGGFVPWEGEIYRARSNDWGVFSTLGSIEDGMDGQATNCAMSLFPPDDESFDAWIAPEMQGAVFTFHMGAVDRDTGLLIGEPDLLLRAELDEPKLSGPDGGLTYELITEEARMLEANDERRLTDPFIRSVWPLDTGGKFVTGLTEDVHWRSPDPSLAVG